MRLNVPVLVAGLLTIAQAGLAQQPSEELPLVSGARVRVTAAGLVSPLVAKYLELRRDTLVLFEDGGGRGIWAFSLRQVEKLEASAGDQSFHRPYVLRGGLYGAGGGAVLGVLFASIANPSDPTREYSRPGMGLIGAAVGAGVGAIIGSRFVAERWTAVPLPRGLSLQGRPFGLAVTF